MALALRSIQEFARVESFGGLLLLLFTVLALTWANSPFAESYFRLWHTNLVVGIGDFLVAKPLLLWINDGLMAMFFFVVSLEIKREVLVGELASPRKAALPVIAAIGGMVVPAGLYLALNGGSASAPGWGIPVATDIAFAFGVLALLGPRVPLALKVFLTTLAVADDIGAVVVIALFYATTISWPSLAVGGVFLLVMIAANRGGVRSPLVYAMLGIAGLWFPFLLSGIHATVAGVLAALTIPARVRLSPREFVARGQTLLQEFDRAGRPGRGVLTNDAQLANLQALKMACASAETPLQRLEHGLHPWVSFAVMPLFALANAGVALGDVGLSALIEPATLGIVAGLVVGKPLGITAASWLAVRSGLATLPADVRWSQLAGIGCLGGIGFTMSLFIAGLAFGDSPFLPVAKVGILSASVIAGVLGSLVLRRPRPRS